MAADEKSRAWRLFSRHPIHPNKERYRHACAAMKEIQQWAQRRWQDDLTTKLSGRSVGNKSWWITLKQQQGLTPDDTIPPLFKSDGTVATKNKDKAEQCRDVAGLCVVYKTHKQHVPHLAALRQPSARPHGHTTRTAATRDHQLIVSFARTEKSLRSFLPRYTRVWNRMPFRTTVTVSLGPGLGDHSVQIVPDTCAAQSFIRQSALPNIHKLYIRRLYSVTQAPQNTGVFILILASTIPTSPQLSEVLSRLNDANITLKLAKPPFGRATVTYLGHEVAKA
ncbi:hypothetical protein GWK47_002543 [Chionoecetes opilio]|uniref:Uncharacterized protein n=1 Tax=Chionoecetes opilio TaxID=41210 RepID=A0A8J4XMP8_CHIOP|nr:hypothetical protein GWK47_002543 [Chionoecetes opilio]